MPHCYLKANIKFKGNLLAAETMYSLCLDVINIVTDKYLDD